MSWRDAPLYVRCHDLARDLVPRMARVPVLCPILREELARETIGLLRAVSLDHHVKRDLKIPA